jgi:hypothetical protein
VVRRTLKEAARGELQGSSAQCRRWSLTKVTPAKKVKDALQAQRTRCFAEAMLYKFG